MLRSPDFGLVDPFLSRRSACRREVLRDPQVVAEKARGLGMVDGGPPAFLASDGSVKGVPMPATLANRVPILPPAVKKPAALNPRPIIVEAPPETRKSRADRTNAGDTDRTSRQQTERRDRNGSTRPNSGDRSTR